MLEKSFENEKREYNFKEKCNQCLKGPKQIIRSVVLLTCIIVVIFQITECLRKIRNPPITTYTHFDFNDTIKYPAVTICRDPPYKADVLEAHGLYGHPRFTSEWRNFNFDDVNLDDFWIESTYSHLDNFISYGFNESENDVTIKNSLHFILGQCQTIYPKIELFITSKHTGYSFLLNHSTAEMENTPSTIPPGYHVYIHQVEEPFSELASVNLMEYLYVNVGEELEVKLGIQQLKMLPSGPKICFPEHNYSSNMCALNCTWDKIVKTVGCSGPWIDMDAPNCNNYTNMKDLIVNYIKLVNSPECNCLQRCHSSLYNTYVVDRNAFPLWNSISKNIKRSEITNLQTQLYIYFNNKLVSVYEESHSYDWSLFLADFGGSLGFLLGLSVLGVIIILEDIFDVLIKPFLPTSGFIKNKNDEIKKNTIGSIYNEGFEYNNDNASKDYKCEEKKLYI